MLYYIVIWYTSNSLQACELQPTRLLCPWDSLGKNTGVGNHIPLQGIFLTQESNLSLLHCRQILYLLIHQGREQYTVSHSVQFSSVVQLCLTHCNPMNRSTARPPCASPTPGVQSNTCPSSGDAIQPSHPLSSPSLPAPNPSQHQGLFQ